MFLRRTCAVAAVIVVGFAISSWLILGTLDRGRGGGWTTPVASGTAGEGSNGIEEGSGPGDGPGRVAAFPPFVRFPVATAEDARPEVRDGDYVVGVELNGESRAYPLNMLSNPERHVVNDDLGGQPIAVTWCGLCQSPIVYSRRMAGRTLLLQVPGTVYGENMVIQDVETGSEWPQLLGEALNGPLKGQSLQQIPSVWTAWKTWRTEHPDTTVLKLSHKVDYYRSDGDRASGSRELSTSPASSSAWSAAARPCRSPSRSSSGSRSSTTRSRAWPSSSSSTRRARPSRPSNGASATAS